MKRVWTFLLACLVFPFLGCDQSDREIELETVAQWRKAPGSVADMGFWIQVDVAWPDKAKSCAPLPSKLRVTVNGREAERLDFSTGECVWDVLYQVGPFTAAMGTAITVRVQDGGKLLGEAFYDSLFPTCAIPLVNPETTQVHAGDRLAFRLPPPRPSDIISPSFHGEFYWLDPPAGIPPFYTYGPGERQTDGETILVKLPTLTGRAAMVFEACGLDSVPAKSCTGFSHCSGTSATATAPIELEIIP